MSEAKEFLYEIHVSLKYADYILNKIICTQLKLNNIVVKNSSGTNDTQFIVTKWCSRATHSEAIDRANRLANDLSALGAVVERVKVELELPNVLDDYSLNPGEYFEFHIKVPLTTVTDSSTLKTITTKHLAATSMLMQSKSHDSILVVTLRYKDTHKNNTKLLALEAKALLVDDLKKVFPVSSKMHSELCIYDSNIKHDEGWI
jgi:hypothetical protein